MTGREGREAEGREVKRKEGEAKKRLAEPGLLIKTFRLVKS